MNKIKPTEKYTRSEKTKEQKKVALASVKTLRQDHYNFMGDGTRRYRGLETGIKEIDDMTQGLDQFVLLAGRSGSGKTTLAIQMALGVLATRLKENEERAKNGEELLPVIPVLIYSFEMPKLALITNFLQVSAHLSGYDECLARNNIDLQGRNPNLDKHKQEALNAAYKYFFDSKLCEYIYIKDSSNFPDDKVWIREMSDKPNGERSIEQDIKEIRGIHGLRGFDKTDKVKDPVLVVIDSAQDLVDSTKTDSTSAEKKCAEQLEKLQRDTECTLLITSQKNKGSARTQDSYGDVMGSAAWIHKPNTVLMLNSLREIVEKNSGSFGQKERSGLKAELEKHDEYVEMQGRKQMVLHQEKSRYTGGYRGVPIVQFCRYGYFEVGVDGPSRTLIPSNVKKSYPDNLEEIERKKLQFRVK